MGSGHALAPQHPATPGPPASSPPIRWLGLGAATATVGIALGVYNPFVAVTLSAKGFDVAAIGVLAAIAAIGFVVGTPIWGQLADTRLGRPKALAIAGATGGLVLAAIWLPVPLPLVALLFLVGSLFVAAWLSLVDAIVVNAVKDSRRYARLRMISSFTYALAALVGGIIYSSTGFEWSLLLVGVGGVGLALVARRLPDVARARADRAPAGRPSWSATATAPAAPPARDPGPAASRCSRSPSRFLGYMAGNTFMGLYLLELGGSPAAVGLASAISAAIEVPAIFVAGIVAQRYGIRVLFVVAAASATTSVAGWAVAPDVAFVLACRLFAGVGYGGMLVAGVMAVRYFVAPERQATGQGLFQATCFGAAAVIVNVVGGPAPWRHRVSRAVRACARRSGWSGSRSAGGPCRGSAGRRRSRRCRWTRRSRPTSGRSWAPSERRGARIARGADPRPRSPGERGRREKKPDTSPAGSSGEPARARPRNRQRAVDEPGLDRDPCPRRRTRSQAAFRFAVHHRGGVRVRGPSPQRIVPRSPRCR